MMEELIAIGESGCVLFSIGSGWNILQRELQKHGWLQTFLAGVES
jgi:hypothetical protein